MAQVVKSREHGKADYADNDYIEVDVTIHGTYIGKVRVRKGATVVEILEEVKKKALEKKLDIGNLAGWSILLNDRDIRLTIDGRVNKEDNVVVVKNAILVLAKRIVGG